MRPVPFMSLAACACCFLGASAVAQETRGVPRLLLDRQLQERSVMLVGLDGRTIMYTDAAGLVRNESVGEYLAIIPALLVAEGGEHYAIPQINLVELVRLEGDLARRGIERVHDAAVYRLRGNLLPLVFLDQLLAGSPARSGEALQREVVNIVVLNAEDRQFGLVVDKIADTAEIVVKPLSKLLKNTAVFAGATMPYQLSASIWG